MSWDSESNRLRCDGNEPPGSHKGIARIAWCERPPAVTVNFSIGPKLVAVRDYCEVCDRKGFPASFAKSTFGSEVRFEGKPFPGNKA